MSGSRSKTRHVGISDIEWNLLDNGGREIGKGSGIKIEYSTSDEIVFAQKLSIITRKTLMRQLLQNEKDKHQRELDSIGLLYTRDTVCEEIRKCNREVSKKNKINLNNAPESNLSKLFKMYEN